MSTMDFEGFDEDAMRETTYNAIRDTADPTLRTAGGPYRNKVRRQHLQDALDDAWVESGLPPGTQFRVNAIWGIGQNPFTGYRVELVPDVS